MDSTSSNQVLHDFSPVFRIYKDGRIERFNLSPFVPASEDPSSTAGGGGVRSKDVVVSPENNVSVRLFLPHSVDKDLKLPVLIYIHGGAFAVGSAFSSAYHGYVSSLVEESNILAVSIEYRLAPENPIPACFEDCLQVLNWVASDPPESWINEHADLSKVFVAGDSAGATLTHYTVARASVELEEKVKIAGMILVHPFFGCGNQVDGLWETLCADETGPDDPRLNPMADSDALTKLRCGGVLVCTAEKDFLRNRGVMYVEGLKKSGWGGEIETVETEGEGHVFHLWNPNCEKAKLFMNRVVSFIKSKL